MRRIDELTNATDRDRSAILIGISENIHARRDPDWPMTYQVTLPDTGEILLDAARDPEHQAARVLQGRGITGRMVTCYSGSSIIAMRMGIAWAAGKSTTDAAVSGPKVGTFKPRPVAEIQRSSQ